jgi:hypothetical protein
MSGIFGQVLSAFKGILSNAFWFGAFLPVAVFAAINLLLAAQVSNAAGDLLTQIGTEKWTWLIPAMLGLIVVGYVLAPMVRMFRALFDGRRMPDWLFTLLLPSHVVQRDDAEVALRAAILWQNLIKEWQQRAQSSLAAAKAIPQRPVPPGGDSAALIAAAYNRLRRLQRRIRAAKSIADAEVFRVETALAAARLATPPAADPLIDSLEQSFFQGLAYLGVMAGSHAARRMDRVRRLPPQVQATSIGNVRQYLENYANDVYGADFEFLWSRVQAVIRETDAIAKRIEAARSLADFAVLSLLLTILTMLIWLPLLAMLDTTPWRFLAVGMVGPVTARLFFYLVVESQVSLGEIAQIAIDRFRFDVLKALHIKPPLTLSAERQIWKAVCAAARGEGRWRRYCVDHTARMSHSMIAALAAMTMVLILAGTVYFSGNIRGVLAALYCLLLTAGCALILSRHLFDSPATSVAMQTSISRQRVLEIGAGQCAKLVPGSIRPMAVRGIVCPAAFDADCVATLDVPADQLRTLLTVGQSVSVSGWVACQ